MKSLPRGEEKPAEPNGGNLHAGHTSMFRSLRRQRYKILGLILVGFLLIRVGLIWCFPDGRIHLTQDSFYKLRIGMTEEEVASILSRGNKIEEETFTMWTFSDGVILIEFENGRLKEKDFVLNPEPIRPPRFPRF
jgi:hypothetical protein